MSMRASLMRDNVGAAVIGLVITLYVAYQYVQEHYMSQKTGNVTPQVVDKFCVFRNLIG